MPDMMFNDSFDRRLCVAPMMDWTDRHCRYFHRVLAPSALLYTEMVTTGAVLNGNRQLLLGFSPEERPLALQLGGCEPGELASCARIAEQWGYDEVNLNVGCPSDRVQKGRFGACLMLEPERVRDGVAAMNDAVEIPVTVKTRLGVDDHDSWDCFIDFVDCVAESGCGTFIIHARKAWLSGLSPKENRDVPELRHEWVYRLKRERPALEIILNGGVMSATDAAHHLEFVDGVMLGRAAYREPWVLARCQQALFGAPMPPGREAAVQAMTDYMAREVARGVPVARISRHMLGLYKGQPGGRQWRRFIAQNAHRDPSNLQLLKQAMSAIVTGPTPSADAA